MATLEALDSSDEAQEAGILAVELLRFGLINGVDLNGARSVPSNADEPREHQIQQADCESRFNQVQDQHAQPSRLPWPTKVNQE